MRLKTAVPMILLLLLCACGASEDGAAQGLALRQALTEAGGCSFTLALTADYGDWTRDFTLSCQAQQSSAQLTILEPEIAQGITATVSGQDAQVCYEDTVLAVEDFSSRPISPMAAPYLLGRAWWEGYIRDSGQDGGLTQITYLLGYGGRQLEVITYFSENTPQRAEITDGTTVLLTCDIQNFTLQKKAERNEYEHIEADLGGD